MATGFARNTYILFKQINWFDGAGWRKLRWQIKLIQYTSIMYMNRVMEWYILFLCLISVRFLSVTMRAPADSWCCVDIPVAARDIVRVAVCSTAEIESRLVLWVHWNYRTNGAEQKLCPFSLYRIRAGVRKLQYYPVANIHDAGIGAGVLGTHTIPSFVDMSKTFAS